MPEGCELTEVSDSPDRECISLMVVLGGKTASVSLMTFSPRANLCEGNARLERPVRNRISLDWSLKGGARYMCMLSLCLEQIQ